MVDDVRIEYGCVGCPIIDEGWLILSGENCEFSSLIAAIDSLQTIEEIEELITVHHNESTEEWEGERSFVDSRTPTPIMPVKLARRYRILRKL